MTPAAPVIVPRAMYTPVEQARAIVPPEAAPPLALFLPWLFAVVVLLLSMRANRRRR